jgi:hypothetical protein
LAEYQQKAVVFQETEKGASTLEWAQGDVSIEFSDFSSFSSLNFTESNILLRAVC